SPASPRAGAKRTGSSTNSSSRRPGATAPGGATSRSPSSSSDDPPPRRAAPRQDPDPPSLGIPLPDAFIFSDAIDGSAPWRPDSTSRRFRAAREAAGIGDCALYGIRHRAATTLIDHGVDPKTVSERLGNSVVTVLSTYTRVRRDADRSAA